MSRARRIVALSGGVGGAKLAQGLSLVLAPEELLIVANTGDDFVHLGLHICPDVDTLLYTLGGVADDERGWGRAEETWSFMEAVAALGGPTWFRLGDRDLAIHLLRTQQLARGAPLSEVTGELALQLGVRHGITPMADEPVRTIVYTDDGALPFQDYFVRRQCQPRVRRLEFAGAADARPAPALALAMRDDTTTAIVLCPSNPYLSIDPILSVPGVRAWLEHTAAPVIAVSPIIGGEAVRGPAARLLRELAGESSALEVVRHYLNLIDLFVLDRRDAGLAPAVDAMGVRAILADTLMQSNADRRKLADTIIKLIDGPMQAGVCTVA